MEPVVIALIIFFIFFAQTLCWVAIANRQKDGKDGDPVQAAGESIQAGGDALEALEAAHGCCY